jgi:hypothetical protein
MRASFPVELEAFFLGKSREGGEFTTTDGDKVEYGEAVDLSFDSSEGLTQTVRVAVKQLDDAADFDVLRVDKFTPLLVIGDVHIRDNGGSFRPTEVRLAKVAAAQKAA